MSWLFKSLQSDDPNSPSSPPHSPSSPSSVKDDLSVLGETIGRQLRAVANFLAPPPSPPAVKPEPDSQSSDSSQSPSSSSSQALLGIRNDLAEIGGTLKSGLSKFTSNFLQFQHNEEDDDDDYGVYDDDDVPGISEEVIGFVKEISLRPECWMDFPLPLQNDFRISDVQREHASNIEHLVPSLAEVRNNVVGRYMGEEQFWMVYFILLIPRLNERDFEILSTPQIVETRNALLQKLQNKNNVMVESSGNSSAPDSSQNCTEVSDTQGENSASGEEVTGVVNATEGLKVTDKENTKHLKEKNVNISSSMDHQKQGEDEDVSFSDLEDDDSDFSARLSASRKAQNIRAPSPSGSSDWVQLNESSETQVGPLKARQSFSRDKDSDAESNDWLKVDEFD